jgi:hypothetical protein
LAQESFRNWQSRSIDQKQSSSSLLVGLSGAALGFAVSLLPKDAEFIGRIASALFHLCVLTHLLSIACGVAFSINRVRDFDLTAKISRDRATAGNQSSLKMMRQQARRLGRLSRRMFGWQAILFVVGAVAFVAFALSRFMPVLYP